MITAPLFRSTVRPFLAPARSPSLNFTYRPQQPVADELPKLPTGSITIRFGERLRLLRKERGMTQCALARHMGIDRSFISDVERGRKHISLDYLDTLAKGFKLSLPEMLKGL